VRHRHSAERARIRAPFNAFRARERNRTKWRGKKNEGVIEFVALVSHV